MLTVQGDGVVGNVSVQVQIEIPPAVENDAAVRENEVPLMMIVDHPEFDTTPLIPKKVWSEIAVAEIRFTVAPP
jgi:hypothetical protein